MAIAEPTVWPGPRSKIKFRFKFVAADYQPDGFQYRNSVRTNWNIRYPDRVMGMEDL